MGNLTPMPSFSPPVLTHAWYTSLIGCCLLYPAHAERYPNFFFLPILHNPRHRSGSRSLSVVYRLSQQARKRNPPRETETMRKILRRFIYLFISPPADTVPSVVFRVGRGTCALGRSSLCYIVLLLYHYFPARQGAEKNNTGWSFVCLFHENVRTKYIYIYFHTRQARVVDIGIRWRAVCWQASTSPEPCKPWCSENTCPKCQGLRGALAPSKASYYTHGLGADRMDNGGCRSVCDQCYHVPTECN